MKSQTYSITLRQALTPGLDRSLMLPFHGNHRHYRVTIIREGDEATVNHHGGDTSVGPCRLIHSERVSISGLIKTLEEVCGTNGLRLSLTDDLAEGINLPLLAA